MRLASKDAGTKEMASRAHQFREMYESKEQTLILPGVSSEGREYLPVGLVDDRSAISNLAFALYDAPLWNMAIIASRLHLGLDCHGLWQARNAIPLFKHARLEYLSAADADREEQSRPYALCGRYFARTRAPFPGDDRGPL